VKLPPAPLRAANLEESNTEEAARLLALELYREDKVSLGRAAGFATCHWRLSWISPQSTKLARF
jgi:predicted HTH domain antitoxin